MKLLKRRKKDGIKLYIMRLVCFIFYIFFSVSTHSQIRVIDSVTKYPVSYATVSFGNGNGVFADSEGVFIFNKKRYPDIDSLFISSLGYKSLKITSEKLTDTIKLSPKSDELEEVLITSNINRTFKLEELKPHLDDDYYNCWLPTIESEIGVYFPKTTDKDQKIENVTFPIALEAKDWSKRKKSKSEKKKFSTLFKVNFYDYKNGHPNKPLTNQTIVFRATEKDGNSYTIDVSDYNIIIPDSGFVVSLQVMGYTDKTGKLLPNKKYKEIKSRNNVIKIPTNFRPLLPFTNKISTYNTFIKRVFINGNKWTPFKQGLGIKSSLLDKNLFNYGVGVVLKTYNND